jgi:hypothetical protein
MINIDQIDVGFKNVEDQHNTNEESLQLCSHLCEVDVELRLDVIFIDVFKRKRPRMVFQHGNIYFFNFLNDWLTNRLYLLDFLFFFLQTIASQSLLRKPINSSQLNLLCLVFIGRVFPYYLFWTESLALSQVIIFLKGYFSWINLHCFIQ